MTSMVGRVRILTVGVALVAGQSLHGQQSVAPAQVQSAVRTRVAITQALPRMDGNRLEVRIVEVTYPPGGVSRPHSHPCAVIGYMLEGTMRMQVKGFPEAVYRAGDTFYEAPNGVHALAANVSPTEPARFLAYFTCDRDTPLTVPVPDTVRNQR